MECFLKRGCISSFYKQRWPSFSLWQTLNYFFLHRLKFKARCLSCGGWKIEGGDKKRARPLWRIWVCSESSPAPDPPTPSSSAPPLFFSHVSATDNRGRHWETSETRSGSRFLLMLLPVWENPSGLSRCHWDHTRWIWWCWLKRLKLCSACNFFCSWASTHWSWKIHKKHRNFNSQYKNTSGDWHMQRVGN